MRDIKLKHEELTIAVDKLRLLEVLNGRPQENPFASMGIYEVPLDELQDALRWDISWAPRGTLEKDTSKVHFIPYIAVRVRASGETTGIMTYKRPDNANGEQLLVGKRSIAVGGHPDITDHVHFNGATDLLETLKNAAVREILEEIKIIDIDDDDIIRTCTNELRYAGVMLDWDQVGLVHLAVLFVVDVDPTDLVQAKAPDEIQDLKIEEVCAVVETADGVYENWSDTYADYLAVCE